MQLPKPTNYQGFSLPLLDNFQLRPWRKRSSEWLWKKEVSEKWTFSKLSAYFSQNQSIRILTQKREPNVLPIEGPCASRRVTTETRMKLLNCVFFGVNRIATSTSFNTICASWFFIIAEISKMMCSSKSTSN